VPELATPLARPLKPEAVILITLCPALAAVLPRKTTGRPPLPADFAVGRAARPPLPAGFGALITEDAVDEGVTARLSQVVALGTTLKFA
jgi:hypothetical protein